MNIDVGAAILRHHEAEAFLIIEEFDLAVDHRSRWTVVALAMGCEPVAAAKSVATAKAISSAKPVSSSEAIATSKTVPAKVAK